MDLHPGLLAHLNYFATPAELHWTAGVYYVQYKDKTLEVDLSDWDRDRYLTNAIEAVSIARTLVMMGQ